MIVDINSFISYIKENINNDNINKIIDDGLKEQGFTLKDNKVEEYTRSFGRTLYKCIKNNYDFYEGNFYKSYDTYISSGNGLYYFCNFDKVDEFFRVATTEELNEHKDLLEEKEEKEDNKDHISKFKIGDFLFHKGYNMRYCIEYYENENSLDCYDKNNWDFWTINDIKTGDTFISKNGDIFIIKNISNYLDEDNNENISFTKYFNYNIFTDELTIKNDKKYNRLLNNIDIFPVNRTISIFLEQKLRLKGYCWDSHKNTLIKKDSMDLNYIWKMFRFDDVIDIYQHGIKDMLNSINAYKSNR